MPIHALRGCSAQAWDEWCGGCIEQCINIDNIDELWYLKIPKEWSTTNVADEPMGSISHEVVDCGNKLSVEGIV